MHLDFLKRVLYKKGQENLTKFLIDRNGGNNLER